MRGLSTYLFLTKLRTGQELILSKSLEKAQKFCTGATTIWSWVVQKEVEVWRRAREAGAEEERLVVDVADKLEMPQITSEREVRTGAGIPSL